MAIKLVKAGERPSVPQILALHQSLIAVNNIHNFERKTQLSTQIKFYKEMAVPVVMYGSENWSLNRSDKRKIEAAEMRFLRPTAGYTLLNKKK